MHFLASFSVLSLVPKDTTKYSIRNLFSCIKIPRKNVVLNFVLKIKFVRDKGRSSNSYYYATCSFFSSLFCFHLFLSRNYLELVRISSFCVAYTERFFWILNFDGFLFLFFAKRLSFFSGRCQFVFTEEEVMDIASRIYSGF
jgi:hypothetical protein